jgi:hypothetical protein
MGGRLQRHPIPRSFSGLVLITILAMIGLLSACASADLGSPGMAGGSGGVTSSDAKPAGAPVPPGAPALPAESAMGRESDAAAPGSPAIANAQQSASAPWDRRIIRNVSLQLATEDVERAVAQARTIASSVDGFVAQSQTRYENDRMYATLTLQVPASAFDSVVSQLRSLAIRVDSETGTSQDVTEEFVDLEAQVRNLQATETSLQRLLDRATRIEDILAINRELNQVRSQIERFQGRLNFLTRRTEFGTISVQFTPPGVSRIMQTGWQPLETARRAFEASLRVVQNVVDAVITVIVFFWWLIPLMIILIPIVRAVGAVRRPAPPPVPPAP